MVKYIFMVAMLFAGIPFSLSLIDADDKLLDDTLGPLGSVLKFAVPDRNIADNPINVGVFESSIYLSTSILEPIMSRIQTSKGSFVVVGNVSGIKGSPVTLRGLSDSRLNNTLCIKDKCYKLLDAPGV